ncbi:MAG: 2-hydroxyacid dehydrogenase [Endozoicomonas sp.]
MYNKKSGEIWTSAVQRTFPAAEVRQWQECREENWLADYAVVWQPPIELFHQQTRLKAAFNQGVGVDHLISLEGLPEDLPIFKLRGVGMEESMSDYITYGLLHFFREFDRYRNQQAGRVWKGHRIESKSDWTVGILGLGVIGRAVASSISSLGFPVMGWSRSEKQIDGIHCYAGENGLDEVVSRSRVLVSLLPATVETRNLIDQKMLGKLPGDSVLINGGRGSVVDLDAVQAALDTGQLRGAMLDVFEHEPLDRDHPLWACSQVIITPHIAAPTPVSEAMKQIATNIRMIESGEMPEAIDRSSGY